MIDLRLLIKFNSHSHERDLVKYFESFNEALPQCKHVLLKSHGLLWKLIIKYDTIILFITMEYLENFKYLPPESFFEWNQIISARLVLKTLLERN